MAKTKKIHEEKVQCSDKFCPTHGINKLRLRGRVFQGAVVKKTIGKVAIEFERMHKVPKYERYEKRKTKLHARLPDCMKNEIEVGDIVEIEETRPISKTIHSIVTTKVRGAKE